MSVTLSTVEASNPQAMTAAAGRLAGAIGELDSVMAAQRQALTQLRAAWQGAAADAAVARAERDLSAQAHLRARLQVMQEALATGGAQLGTTREGILGLVSALRAAGWTVSDDGRAHAPMFPLLLKQFEPGFTAIIQRLLELFAEIDATTAGAIRTALGGAPPENPPGVPLPTLPPAGASAEEVNRWWNSLSDADKQQLTEAAPRELGNLDGLPVAVRDEINRSVMERDIARVEQAARSNGVSTEQVAAAPERYGLSEADVTAYQNGLKAQAGLEHQRASDNPNRPRPVYLFGYDPLAYGGEGTAAIALGNPDTADNIGVIVPGTGSSLSSGWLNSGRNDGINLLDQMNKADPSQQHSVLMWMGYDAPDSFTDPRIANPLLARAGGDLLAGDVNSLHVTHAGTGTPEITVLGHSYGSTTVADAFAGSGMQATNAVLLGCPGTDLADSAADFNLQGGQVYVGNASTDPVGWIGAGDLAADVLNGPLGSELGTGIGLGSDAAAESFGAVRFKSEVPGGDLLDFNDHSYYYTMGSESLYSMAAISSGHGDALGDLGMLAGERVPPTLTTPDRIPTPLGDIPLPHTDIPVGPAVLDPEAGRPNRSLTSDHNYDNPI
ncbi:alpha/beta hydrolase [Mycolicibacterium duvalii]|uniref:alpha/beta hydrolase n=1 Tax=Mycolicibacterium duvalii TaxID=39688 RepID=UPI000BEECCA0|nr:alpha/beta hydrolase [Mycolicibacterium duvalii]MCV7367652.1 alpha/beta hydrolase [Mycolicibacterium duvalii]PEG35114.1 alpha/beta hydrolase [Mycolicibacterium duvalii]